MRVIKYKIGFVSFGLSCFLWFVCEANVFAAPRLQDTGEKTVIVIDPGHGGVNEGTIAGEYPEKIMTLISAQAMYEELIQFDDVEVHMTRTDDRELSLADRAELAKKVDADFLFSLHYNASEYHTMFGTEVWVSCEPTYNAYGYQFGYLQMQEMQDLGLFLRGIKTKLNDQGKDYYGILRESAEREVPAVIIEHCHVDESRDIPYCKTEEDWIKLGQTDAHAVAKYFGLSSKSLDLDYSEDSNQLPKVNENCRVQSTMRDETAPDVCTIELLNADDNTGEITIQVTAVDYDSPLLYYDYSLDGGTTYCPLIPWPDVDALEGTYTDVFTLTLQIESGMQPEIIVRAYNFADLYTESNLLPFLQPFSYGEAKDDLSAEETQKVTDSLPERERHSAGTTTFLPAFANTEEGEKEVSILTFLQICLVFVIVLFGVVIISQIITYRRRRKRRRQHRKDFGESKNQPR